MYIVLRRELDRAMLPHGIDTLVKNFRSEFEFKFITPFPQYMTSLHVDGLGTRCNRTRILPQVKAGYYCQLAGSIYLLLMLLLSALLCQWRIDWSHQFVSGSS